MNAYQQQHSSQVSPRARAEARVLEQDDTVARAVAYLSPYLFWGFVSLTTAGIVALM